MAISQANMIERRIFNRHFVNAGVQLMHGAIGKIKARTRDISDSGVFVEIYPVPKLPAGSHVKMYMLDSSLPMIAFNMKVIRSTTNGIGLKFIDFEVDGQRFTMDALREHLQKK